MGWDGITRSFWHGLVMLVLVLVLVLVLAHVRVLVLAVVRVLSSNGTGAGAGADCSTYAGADDGVRDFIIDPGHFLLISSLRHPGVRSI